MNKFLPTQTLKDAKVAHLSTWIVISDPALAHVLEPLVGEDTKPLTVRVRHFGNEDSVQVYNSMPMDAFLALLSVKIGREISTVTVKVVEDTLIRRIDKRVMNIDNPNIKNTLRDLKIVDNSALLIEEKSEEELTESTEVVGLPSTTDTVNIDSTENIRTVIVNLESDPNTFERYSINIDWTVQQLLDYILTMKSLEPPHKLRNLTTSRHFVREELETKLRSYEDFREGGARVQLEYGRLPTMSEMIVNVSMKGDQKYYENFYVPSNATVKDL